MAASSSHNRTLSEDTIAAAAGASYNLILEHVLAYPGSYEMPLRTMYTLNCAPRAQPLPQQLTQTNRSDRLNPTTSSTTPPSLRAEANSTNAQLTSSLMTKITQLPSQPCSLPPSFINTFVRRCFPSRLPDVDFPQALTALDYMKDLEQRRRREVANALHRLGIERNDLGSESDDLSSKYPGVVAWVKDVEEKERKIEALYTQLYVGMRRWILINEMSLEPFNKHNCVAMLNTLYPPVVISQPTSKLTPTILKSQRDGFFRYIQAVEKNSPRVLENLMQQGKKPGDPNGWSAVAETVDMYLRVACGVIEECNDIINVEAFTAATDRSKRKGKKTDSGVAFDSDSRRPSTGDSKSILSASRSPTPSAAKTRPGPPVRGGSTLERIARELRRMGKRNKFEVEEIVQHAEDKPPSARQTSKTLRKMKSLGALGELRHANASGVSLSSSNSRKAMESPSFDKDEMLRQRLIYEARSARSPMMGV